MACTGLFLTRPCLLLPQIMIFTSTIKMMQSACMHMSVHTEILTTPKKKKLSLWHLHSKSELSQRTVLCPLCFCSIGFKVFLIVLVKQSLISTIVSRSVSLPENWMFLMGFGGEYLCIISIKLNHIKYPLTTQGLPLMTSSVKAFKTNCCVC